MKFHINLLEDYGAHLLTGLVSQGVEMLIEQIEHRWLAAFERTFALCKVQPNEVVALLTESQSRRVNVDLARLGIREVVAAGMRQIRQGSQQNRCCQQGTAQGAMCHDSLQKAGGLIGLQTQPVLRLAIKNMTPGGADGEADGVGIPIAVGRPRHHVAGRSGRAAYVQEQDAQLRPAKPAQPGPKGAEQRQPEHFHEAGIDGQPATVTQRCQRQRATDTDQRQRQGHLCQVVA